jgi:hypothetical protein
LWKSDDERLPRSPNARLAIVGVVRLADDARHLAREIVHLPVAVGLNVDIALVNRLLVYPETTVQAKCCFRAFATLAVDAFCP